MIEAIANPAEPALSDRACDVVGPDEAALAEAAFGETIRELEQAIGEARAQIRFASAKRLHVLRQAHRARDEIADLAQRAREALILAREDLALAAVSRLVELESFLIALADAERDAANAEHRFERHVAALVALKKEMEASVAVCADARSEPKRGFCIEVRTLAFPARRLERFAAICECARQAVANSAPIAPIEAESGATLNVARREQRISNRLAALKAAM